MAELVEDVEHPILAAVVGAILHEVIGAHMTISAGLQARQAIRFKKTPDLGIPNDSIWSGLAVVPLMV
jgi:hypothetical protein